MVSNGVMILIYRNNLKADIDMTKLYGYDRNDDGIMLNKRIY